MPTPPENLMTPPSEFKLLDMNNVTDIDVLTVSVENAEICNNTRDKLISLQAWANGLKRD